MNQDDGEGLIGAAVSSPSQNTIAPYVCQPPLSSFKIHGWQALERERERERSDSCRERERVMFVRGEHKQSSHTI